MAGPVRLERPSKDQIASLPVYEGLPLNKILLVRTEGQAEFAARKLGEAKFIGFDTETKPVFSATEQKNGPHVIQFATLDHAFVLQVRSELVHGILRSVIESDEIIKIGFGLKSDRGPLRRKLGLRLGASCELSQIVKKLGYRQSVGVKAAVAIVLGRRLPKPKSGTLSNWSAATLSPRQLKYAADDAYAALQVFHALGRPYVARVGAATGGYDETATQPPCMEGRPGTENV
jgi:ribonuclease D